MLPSAVGAIWIWREVYHDYKTDQTPKNEVQVNQKQLWCELTLSEDRSL